MARAVLNVTLTGAATYAPSAGETVVCMVSSPSAGATIRINGVNIYVIGGTNNDSGQLKPVVLGSSDTIGTSGSFVIHLTGFVYT